VAEPVVDSLEIVDVEIDDAERTVRTARSRAFDFDGRFECASIEQAGQGIGAGTSGKARVARCAAPARRAVDQ